MGFYGLGETKQAAAWVLLCESFPVRLQDLPDARGTTNREMIARRVNLPGQWTGGGSFVG